MTLSLRTLTHILFLCLIFFNNKIFADVNDQELAMEIKLRNKEIFKDGQPTGNPTFFPVEFDLTIEKNMLILPFICENNETVKWHSEYESFISGLKPGSRIRAYSKNGNFVNGSLGPAQCFIGACTANYVSLPIDTDTEIKEVVVVSKAESITVNNVEISLPIDCENLPLQKEDPHGFGFEPLATTCNEVLDSANNNKILGELVSFGWQQSNGWDVYEQFFRIVSSELSGQKTYGKLNQISYSTPSFSFYSKGVY